jgi:hypothetical protein
VWQTIVYPLIDPVSGFRILLCTRAFAVSLSVTMQRNWKIADDEAKSRRGQIDRGLLEGCNRFSDPFQSTLLYLIISREFICSNSIALNERREALSDLIPDSSLVSRGTSREKASRRGRNFFYATREDDRETHKRWRGNKGYGTSFPVATWILMRRSLYARVERNFTHTRSLAWL